jgi:hypothetical protein
LGLGKERRPIEEFVWPLKRWINLFWDDYWYYVPPEQWIDIDLY